MAPTRVHERYGFPFFAIGAMLFAISPRWRVAYVVLSIATFANMYVVPTTIYPPTDPTTNPIARLARRSDRGSARRSGSPIVAVMHTVGLDLGVAPAAALAPGNGSRRRSTPAVEPSR